MSKPEWGIKRVCPSCSIKYYDFNKSPINCPKCKFEFDPDLLLKSRKGRSIATKTEVNQTSNDVQKEKETLENDINSIENNEDILEIDDETEVEDNDIDNNINKKINTDDDDIEIIEDGLEDKDEFSIEIDDADNTKIQDQK